MDNTENRIWDPAATPPAGSDQVHVWRVLVEPVVGDLERLLDSVSDDERARAGELRHEDHRRRYLVARAVLRQVLARYTGLEARRLEFHLGEHGKPHLAAEVAAGLDFNLSHSGQVVLLAVAWGRRVGVDVEWTGRQVGWERVARRFFAAAEREALLQLPPPQRRGAFFDCWTRKEAYLKARGRGLSAALGSFAVTLGPGAPAALAWAAEQAEGPERWRLEALAPLEGYVGAVCAEGRDWHLRCCAWEPACA